MSLGLDKFFFDALSGDDNVVGIVGDRIANPALTAEQEDKWPLPYIVIMFDGLSNDVESKDDVAESKTDNVAISILCVAEHRDALAQLTQAVRTAIKEAVEDMTDEQWTSYGFYLDDYTFSADGVALDIDKPCVFQTLRYQCDTYNIA